MSNDELRNSFYLILKIAERSDIHNSSIVLLPSLFFIHRRFRLKTGFGIIDFSQQLAPLFKLLLS